MNRMEVMDDLFNQLDHLQNNLSDLSESVSNALDCLSEQLSNVEEVLSLLPPDVSASEIFKKEEPKEKPKKEFAQAFAIELAGDGEYRVGDSHIPEGMDKREYFARITVILSMFVADLVAHQAKTRTEGMRLLKTLLQDQRETINDYFDDEEEAEE